MGLSGVPRAFIGFYGSFANDTLEYVGHLIPYHVGHSCPCGARTCGLAVVPRNYREELDQGVEG